ncbi:MAG: porin [Pseudomonadota bacterium]
MIGGLLKTTSVAALVAVAGVAAGAVSANAADFGGDCCADLEERVAELEATTARKGNRKVSLTIYGQVNQAVMFWDNGDESNTYIVDNDISSTRFGFKGKAKITPDWSAGYKIEIETEIASSSRVTEDSDEGTQGVNIGLRKAEWYLKSKTYGKITVGQGDTANSGITEIDLSGTNVSAQFDNIKAGQDIDAGGLRYDRFTGGGNNEFNRQNRVRYDTPTFGGFIVSAAFGEDDLWDVALRYAGQLGDFKVAAGIAYGEDLDGDNTFGVVNDPAEEVLNGSLSILHTPTGLFVTAGASTADTDGDATEDFYGIRAGISQKFIPLGKTAFYGQYQKYEEDFDAGGFREADVYGGGIVQKIDAAAMELYLDYKHIEVDDDTATEYNDLDVVITGARIKF